jgi:DNA repair protein RadD
VFELRDYQLEALDAVEKSLEENRRVLLQAPTGAGKTVCFAELIRRFMTRYPGMRIALVAHREELVKQNADKLLKVWPGGFMSVGVACASAGRVDTMKPVTVGSVQTMARRKFAEPFKLIVADECHHIPNVESPSQYFDLFRAHEERYPWLRVLGVTATPYRTAHGPIYGDTRRPDRTNFFPRLDWKITLNDLIGRGYLSDWRGKIPADMGKALKGIAKSMGDYDEKALSREMSRPIHIGSAVAAYSKFGEGRRHALVFAVNISHAEVLAEAFGKAGLKAAAVHSKMSGEARRAALDGFDAGELEVLVNVGVLTEGWDSPAVDLIIMCRPTMSPGLYVQMIGRGTRKSPGKEDLLFIDLADNWKAHGDPSSPAVSWGAPGGGDGEPKEPPMKICGNPDCMSLVPLSAKACPVCGWAFPVKKTAGKTPEKMKTVRRDPPAPSPAAGDAAPRGRGRPKPVSGWVMFPYVTRRGALMARLDVHFETGRPTPVYLDFEGRASGFGRAKARRLWEKLSGGGAAAPETVDEAVARFGSELAMPKELTAAKDAGGFSVIGEWQ